jgi:hypothetical protein
MAVVVLGRLSFEVDGERVVVAPLTNADMEVGRSGDGIAVLEMFAGLIEEPADAAERGMPWLAAACRAWQAEVDALLARMSAITNRAARRRSN